VKDPVIAEGPKLSLPLFPAIPSNVQIRKECGEMYVKALKWPVITWVVVDVIFLIGVALFPDIGSYATPGALTPLLLAFGIWAGYKIVQFGGNYLHAAIAGLVVGVVCAILAIVGFGVILASVTGGISAVLPAAVYYLAVNLFGALIGGGFALSK